MAIPTYYLAIDIGASSGRHILGWLENGRIHLEEAHRFENGPSEKNGRLVWDTERLFREILAGLKRCAAMGKRPSRLGVDTWGVDFVLLDKKNALLGDAVCYRDSRTRGMEEKVFAIIPEEELYSRTGIQTLVFNTIYQLYAVKTGEPDLLKQAVSFLTMPDYLNFLLTGHKANEYSEATSTQLINASARDWDWELLDRIGLPAEIFGAVRRPGTRLGALSAAVRAEVGFDCEVFLPPCHDTESAVLALPSTDDDGMYLSSGTWSLLGVERKEPDCRAECLDSDFSNEGGYNGICFHKNIMGLWLIQSLRRELAPDRDFAAVAALAEKGLDCPALFDVNDEAFLAPDSMAEAIAEYCRKSGQPAPSSDAEILGCAYNSLAACYAETAQEVERLLGRTYRRVHIMGGGSRDSLLNRLTAERTGKGVLAGPVEATAIGNILAQMLTDGAFANLAEARRAVADSFAPVAFAPL